MAGTSDETTFCRADTPLLASAVEGEVDFSGVVVAGLGSWLVVRALARTGALSRFAAGREAHKAARV